MSSSVVAPGTATEFLNHWSVGVGKPVTTVVNDAGEPAATVREIGWQVRRTTQAGTDPVAATDSRTVEVRLTLGEEGRLALMRRVNMQVQVVVPHAGAAP